MAFERGWRQAQSPGRQSEGYVEDCSPFELMVMLSSDGVNVVKSGEKGRSFSVRPEEDK